MRLVSAEVGSVVECQKAACAPAVKARVLAMLIDSGGRVGASVAGWAVVVAMLVVECDCGHDL